MGFTTIVMQILAVSLPILLGWCLNKLDIMNDAFDEGVSRLVLNVGLPCTILASIDGVQDLPDAGTLVLLMVATCVLYVVSVVVAFAMTALLGVPAPDRGSFRFAIAFGNCGFIGLPIISAILGSRALLYVAVALIPANVALFSIAPLLFRAPASAPVAPGAPVALGARARAVLAQLKSPTLFASVIVLALALMRVTDLGVLGDALGIVGQMTTPLALLITGSSMAHYRPLEMLVSWRAYVAAAGRLLVVPLACLGAAMLFPLDAFLRAVLVLDCAMPVATVGALWCLNSGCDTKPIMQITFLSVVLSIITIPILAVLLGA